MEDVMSLLNSGETISLFISFIALIVAIIALVYTAKTFWLKSGLEIRGSYSIASSISTEDKYIAQITLENLKDRAIIIFKIYLRISKGIYLEIDDFDQEPLILKPFEVYYKKFDPIDFYLVNTTRVNFDQLLDNYDIKKEIVLSTSEGKYTVKKWIPRWYLVSDYFKNHFTLIIQPIRSIFRDKAYGINTKYIIEIKKDDEEEIIPIYPDDYRIKKFRKFRLTKESLESKEALQEYLNDQVTKSVISCDQIVVHDIDAWRKEVYKTDYKTTTNLESLNWFMYYIVGPIDTKYHDNRKWKKVFSYIKKLSKSDDR